MSLVNHNKSPKEIVLEALKEHDANHRHNRTKELRKSIPVGTTQDGISINCHTLAPSLCKDSKYYFKHKIERMASEAKIKHRLRMKLEQKNQSKPQDEDVPGVPQDKRV